jgi:hypothetical protein
MPPLSQTTLTLTIPACMGVLILLRSPDMTCRTCPTSQHDQLGLALRATAECEGVPCSSWMTMHTPPLCFLLTYKVPYSCLSCPDPCSVCKAMAALDVEGWEEAMDREMKASSPMMYTNWCCARAACRQSHSVGVLLRTFRNSIFEKNKGRLVARGNYQCPGTDYGKPFSVQCMPPMTLEFDHIGLPAWDAQGIGLHGATRRLRCMRKRKLGDDIYDLQALEYGSEDNFSISCM